MCYSRLLKDVYSIYGPDLLWGKKYIYIFFFFLGELSNVLQFGWKLHIKVLKSFVKPNSHCLQLLCCYQDYIPPASMRSVTTWGWETWNWLCHWFPWWVRLVISFAFSIFYFPYLQQGDKWYWPSLLNVLRCVEEKGKAFICSQPPQRFLNANGMQAKGFRQGQGLPKRSMVSRKQKMAGWK